MSGTRRALLFKSLTSNESETAETDPYVEGLHKLSIEPYIIPVIAFEFINLDDLKLKLDHHHLYSGIVFSSPRCVEAVRRCICDGETPVAWRDLKAFTIGERTSLEAKKLGLSTEGEYCGSAKLLAEHIVTSNISKPLLLPTGNLSTNILQESLKGNGIKFDQVIVYNTIPNPNLESILTPLLKEQDIQFVLYFSPSGVDSTVCLLRKLGLDLENCKIGAIGSTTEEAILKHSLKVSFTAKNPTPDQYISALETTL